MTKQEYIYYWKDEALRDWEAANILMNGKQYMLSLFLLHLSIEKLLKAHWVKDNEGSFPPLIHNLKYLYEQTKLTLPQEDINYLFLMNSWNIEGRYPDYKQEFYKKCTKEYTESQLSKVKLLKEWLTDKLQ